MFTIVFNTESMWLWVPISPRRWWFRFNWDVQDFHLRLFTGFTMTFGTCVALVPWPSRWPLGTGVFLWGVSFHVTPGHPFHSAGLSENRAMTWRIFSRAEKPLRLGSKTFFLSVILTAWPGAKMSSSVLNLCIFQISTEVQSGGVEHEVLAVRLHLLLSQFLSGIAHVLLRVWHFCSFQIPGFRAMRCFGTAGAHGREFVIIQINLCRAFWSS